MDVDNLQNSKQHSHFDLNSDPGTVASSDYSDKRKPFEKLKSIEDIILEENLEYRECDVSSSSDSSSPRISRTFKLTSSIPKQDTKKEKINKGGKRDYNKSEEKISLYSRKPPLNWSSFDSVDKYPRSGKKLVHSRAKLDLSKLNGESKPSFTYDSSYVLPFVPRKNISFTSVTDRFSKNGRIGEKLSFTSLPDSVNGKTGAYLTFDSETGDPGHKRIKMTPPWREGCVWNGRSCSKESEEDEVATILSKHSNEDFLDGGRFSGFANSGQSPRRLNKYEIPSFYVFTPEAKQSDSCSTIHSDIEENCTLSEDENESKYATVTVDTEPEERPSTRPVSKFTLPKNRVEQWRIRQRPSKHRVRNQGTEFGQGDTPWILVPDGSDDSGGEEAAVEVGVGVGVDVGVGVGSETWNHYDTIETLPSQATPLEIQNNIKNTALNNKRIGQTEGKISRFFSRLRRSPSASLGADLKHPIPDPDSNGKEPYSVIVSHEDNQSNTKKSKMCVIL